MICHRDTESHCAEAAISKNSSFPEALGGVSAESRSRQSRHLVLGAKSAPFVGHPNELPDQDGVLTHSPPGSPVPVKYFRVAQHLDLGGIYMKKQCSVNGRLWNLNPNRTPSFALPGMFFCPIPPIIYLDFEVHQVKCHPVPSFSLSFIHSLIHSLSKSLIDALSTGLTFLRTTGMAAARK